MNATQMKAPYRALPSALQTHVMWWRGYNGIGECHAGLLHSDVCTGKDVAAVFPAHGRGVRPETNRAGFGPPHTKLYGPAPY